MNESFFFFHVFFIFLCVSAFFHTDGVPRGGVRPNLFHSTKAVKIDG